MVSSPPAAAAAPPLRPVLLTVLAVYLGYAALRLVLPVGNELWGMALILAFYWLPQRVMRERPDFVEKELELREGGSLIPSWSWPAGRWALAVALVVFPPFALSFWWFYDGVCTQGATQGLSPVLWLESLTPLTGKLGAFFDRLCLSYRADFWPRSFHWPPRFFEYAGMGWLLEILMGVFAVALPEEIFHRAFLQGALERRFPPRYRVLGVKMGWAAVAASAIFAVGHLVSLQETSRLATFFPSLLFGWLWRRSGTLWAPTLFHAGSNLLMDLLLASTFPRT